MMLLKAIDKIPLAPLIFLAIFMSLAPFTPEPHLVEKSRMLINGELTTAIDSFDLIWHGFPLILLVVRLLRMNKSAGT